MMVPSTITTMRSDSTKMQCYTSLRTVKLWARRRCWATPKCLLLIPLLFSGLSLLGNFACAEEAKPLGQINDYLRVTGELQSRYEAWDYFQPFPALNNNNDYDYWGLRARLGVLFTTSYVDGYAQGQYSGIYGLPDNAVAVPGGGLGLGAAYFSENKATSPSNLFLKQANLNFKFAALGLPGMFLKVGRFELLDGMEYKTGVTKFDGLKLTRVSQRLVGAFGFTHVSRSFDGFSAVYDQPAFNVTASGVRPTQGGFNVQAQDEISNIDLFYTALTGKKDVLLPDTEGRLFYMYYDDDRNTQALDNRPAIDRSLLNHQNLAIHTIGTHWLTLHQRGADSIDGLLWGAYQFGDWTQQHHRAWALDAEVGYQWGDLPLKPWLRAVYFRGSGDDDSTDGTHKTFFQMLPTVRTYAKFPYFNLMNLQDVFVEMIVLPTQKIKVAIDVHHLSLADSNDLFYAGAGATSRSGSFGYQGRSSGGNNNVGELVDLTFTHALTNELSWSVYYAHAFGGKVISNIYQGKKDADYAFVELSLAF
ncbi:MAG: alginate export family protein [Methylococcales bacterium]|nr:alginate export family protein [Methylococcaceae bacterium]